MSQKSYLEQDFPRFSDRVMEAARAGRLNAAPLLHALERAEIVAQGISAVLRLERANTIHFEAPPDDESEPPLSSGTMSSLLELARVSAESLASNIERLADWADKHGVRDEPHA